MNAATIRTVANSLIIGAVLGFLGGAWAVQATHATTTASTETAREDLTTNAILSSLSRIHDELGHQAPTKAPIATKPSDAHRTSLVSDLADRS